MQYLGKVAVCILFLFAAEARSQTIYVDVNNGNDNNPGTEELSVKTLLQASKIVNALNGEGETEIIIMPGIYYLNEKVQFQNEKNYTENKRFIIRASILPGEEEWSHQKMPVIISTALPTNNFQFDCSVGIDVEMNHVTIQGLKFHGNPVPEIYYYPIGRQGRDLEGLLVTQCMFIGDLDASPIQSAILAHGHKIVVDHCVFNNCKNSVVFYFVGEEREDIRQGSEFRYNIISGGYETGIWTAANDNNFKFHHNIISGCENVWIHNNDNNTIYELSDCIITENDHYICEFTESYETEKSKLSYIENNVIKTGKIDLVQKDDIAIPADYLHVKTGSFGSELNAGLFIKER
ncbi:MAG: hypothetical protein GY863_23510 [bacterium]|nr:hypothetical protein [bacterium]